MTQDPLRDFGVACFCKEGGVPHESNTGTCRHIAEERRGSISAAEISEGSDDAPGCALCETETDEAVEECSECGEFFHPSCMGGHECEKKE